MTLLVVGSVAYDAVKTPFGQRAKTLGGSASFFSSVAAYFGDVSVIAVVGRDFEEAHLDFFKSRGIDVDGVQRNLQGDSFFWSGEYDYNLSNCKTLDTQLNVFADFNPQLNAQHQQAEHVFLANIDPTLQQSVLAQVKAPGFVAMDTMNYWIQNKPQALAEVLRRVDLLFVNDGEARALSGEYNLLSASQKIRAMGPRYLVIKQGEYGAMLFADGEIFRAPAYPLEVVFDPTGAGDSFAGGVMGYLARHKQARGTIDFQVLKRAVVVGCVMASFAVEDFSIDRFRTLTQPDIQSRLTLFHNLTQFDLSAY